MVKNSRTLPNWAFIAYKTTLYHIIEQNKFLLIKKCATIIRFGEKQHLYESSKDLEGNLKLFDTSIKNLEKIGFRGPIIGFSDSITKKLSRVIYSVFFFCAKSLLFFSVLLFKIVTRGLMENENTNSKASSCCKRFPSEKLSLHMCEISFKKLHFL